MNSFTALTAPAYLFCGKEQETEQKALNMIHDTVCHCSATETCTTYKLLLEHQSPFVTAIAPEKRYTLDAFDQLFKQITLTLDQETNHFFIIYKADLLTQACSNSILKTVEEPPAGYHFIFLAQRLHHILPTIRSRCLTEQFSGAKMDTHEHPLLHHFMQINSDPLAFDKELSGTTMTEQECLFYLDALLEYWIKSYKTALIEQHAVRIQKAKKMVTLCAKYLKTPPSMGGTKLFWRNLFLQKITIT